MTSGREKTNSGTSSKGDGPYSDERCGTGGADVPAGRAKSDTGVVGGVVGVRWSIKTRRGYGRTGGDRPTNTTELWKGRFRWSEESLSTGTMDSDDRGPRDVP